MADNELGETQGTEEIELSVGENAPDSQDDGHTPPKKESPPEQALVQALRRFISTVPSGKKPEESSAPEKLGRLQVFTLILLSANAALVYSQLEHWLQNPLFQEVLKVLPWMLGATALGYANALRRLLIDKAHHLKWAILAALLLVPMLVLQMHVFSLQIHSDGAMVKSEDTRVITTEEAKGHFRVVFPGLDDYRITVDEATGGGSATPFSATLGRFRILRGTLAQIPVAGKIFGSEELELSPLYSIPTHSKGDAEVNVEGKFQEGFVDDAVLGTLACRSVKPKRANNQAVQCHVRGEGGFPLPRGKYVLTLLRSGCSKELPIQEIGENNQDIDFEAQCPRQ